MSRDGSSPSGSIHVGTAGWQLPRALRERFPGPGTQLQRYAQRLDATEVNASFYRAFPQSRYRKWAKDTPSGFLFAVKVPRILTHRQRLQGTDGLDDFLEAVRGLGERLGPLLLQLPPGLPLEPEVAGAFLEALRARYSAAVVCEPRHPSWFGEEGEALLRQFRIARAAAHPPPAAGADRPGGWSGLAYFRLHGSPERFRSAYSEAFLEDLAKALSYQACETWCVFNNTATAAGLGNALTLRERLAALPR